MNMSETQVNITAAPAPATTKKNLGMRKNGMRCPEIFATIELSDMLGIQVKYGFPPKRPSVQRRALHHGSFE